MTIANAKQEAELRMQKSIEALQNNFAKIRTGRAHPSLLEQVKVSYYGSDMPLSQVANVSVGDSRTLLVTAWEKAMVPVIEKAILSSGLGLNPTNNGTGAIRVPLPAMNEERRREMIKIVKAEAEDGRIAIRNGRRDANNQCKELLKAKLIGEDEERNAVDDIQKMTDKFVAEVDKMLAVKEAELMEV